MIKLLRCGYTLCSKEVFFPLSASRVLCNQTARRDYCASWSMQQQQKNNTFFASTFAAKHWNTNSFLVNHRRFLSTTLPQNGQTALKPKSPERGNEKKQTKEKSKSIAGDKVGTQSPIETKPENATEKPESVEPIEEEKLTLTAKFKKMYKEYWYVLLPVHVATSTLWLGGFYYLSTR